ncbi:MAG: RNA polymerase subunit sigma [Planctomycetaceae bacterium]|nr:RNA polymerase subunit sigma [Planctomycetaceae bacterium]
MSGPIVRTGTNPAFWANWDNVFGLKTAKKTHSAKKKSTAKKDVAKKSTKKAAAKKTTAKKATKGKK